MTTQFTRILDSDIYARKAVAEAQVTFKKYCTVKATPAGSGQVELAFNIDAAHKDKAQEVVLEFLNYTLDRSIQLDLEVAE